MPEFVKTDVKELAAKFADSVRDIEETAAKVANKTSTRRELTGKVTDSAAELSAYILKRSRQQAA